MGNCYWENEVSVVEFCAGSLDFLEIQNMSGSAANDDFGGTIVLGSDGFAYVSGMYGNEQIQVLKDDGREWQPHSVVVASDATAGDAFGHAMAVQGDTMVVGAYGEDNANGSAAGSVYVFTRVGEVWTQQQKLLAGRSVYVAAYNNMGYSVALDDNTLVIGSQGAEASGGTNHGQVEVWTRADDESPFIFAVDLEDPSQATAQSFGSSVAINDGTMAIGVRYGTVNSKINIGYVLMYSGSGASWSLDAKLENPREYTGSAFAEFVNFSPGGEYLIIGCAWIEDNILNLAKSYAYIHKKTGGSWTLTAELDSGKELDREDGYYDGVSVSMTDDIAVVGDMGFSTVTATTPEQTGAIDVYIRDSEDWPLAQHIEPSSSAEYGYFGRAAVVNGDTIMSGAPSQGTNGRLFIFQNVPIDPLPPGSFISQGVMEADNGAAGDIAGWQVGISGDYAIMGAKGKASSKGGAYIFHRVAGVWTQQQELVMSDGVAGDIAGYAVAISGDYAVVGASNRVAGAYDGGVYIFHRVGAVWSEQLILEPPTPGNGDEFGYWVEIQGDTLAVGVPGYDGYDGALDIYVRDGVTWPLEQRLEPSDKVAEAGNGMGMSISLDGDQLACGNWNGHAYVFTRSGAVWTEQDTFTPVDGNGSADYFAEDLSLSGDYLAAAAYKDDSGAGAFDIWLRTGSTWTLQQRIKSPAPDSSYKFGMSVALIDNATVIVSEPYADVDSLDAVGLVRVFKREGATWTIFQTFTHDDYGVTDWLGEHIAYDNGSMVGGAQKRDTNVGGMLAFVIEN
ncbi:MAG: hypothetical protein DRQ48_11230 [Gammaproteobacteria bacterium]|nr:MAG: hypothetical protein DRQ48_11230 [Gammaproteobacteria bacterium]